MKKIITILPLLIIFLGSNEVLADAASSLRGRIDKINSFYAVLKYEITDKNGNLIQKSQGDLWVKRPNFFHFHMKQPDENILISDGKTLWFYNPFIEQATATWLKDVITNTPFMLIIRLESWIQYNISQNGNNFFLIPKDSNSFLKKITINISRDGIIHQLITLEQGGKHSIYKLKFQHRKKIDSSKFNFIPQPNVTIDDQRN